MRWAQTLTKLQHFLFTTSPSILPKRFHRVAVANITFEVSSCEHGQSDQEVLAVTPSGRWSLAETTHKEHIKRIGSANLTVGNQGASAEGT